MTAADTPPFDPYALARYGVVSDFASEIVGVLPQRDHPLAIVCVGNPRYALDAFGPVVYGKLQGACDDAASRDASDPLCGVRLECIKPTADTPDPRPAIRALRAAGVFVLLVDASMAIPRQLGQIVVVAGGFERVLTGWRRLALRLLLPTVRAVSWCCGIRSPWGVHGGLDQGDAMLVCASYTPWRAGLGWADVYARADDAARALILALQRRAQAN